MIKKLTMMLVAAAAFASATPAIGSTPEAVKPNYELAERFSPTKVKRLVPQTAVRPNWFENSSKFWYSWTNVDGTCYYIVDPATGKRTELWSMAELAEKVTLATNYPFDWQHLPIRAMQLKEDKYVLFDIAPADVMVENNDYAPKDDEGKRLVFHFKWDIATKALEIIEERDVKYPEWANVSPDGRIAVSVDVNGEGTPIYNLTFDGEAIIENSPLGIVTSAVDFTSGLQLVAINHSSSNTTWEPVWGERAVVVDKYNSIDATFKSADGNEIVIVLRVYDDGLGMRYRILGDGSHYVMNETTTFSFVEDCEAHWIAGSYDDDEYAYMHTPMSGITLENMALSSSGNRKLPYPSVNTPVTLITSKGTHVALHEAALWDYPAMSLRYDAETNSFISDLASVQEIKAPVELPFATPWRVVIIGDRAGALVESTIVLNLNEPCRLEDTSWIKPMKYVGVWWEMHLKLSTWDCDGSVPHCATTENVKRYIDFAAENGFGGVLVEGWNVGWGRDERFDYAMPYADFDIDEIVAYGKERGVMLIGHHETYANVENYEEQLEDAYDYYQSKGVGSWISTIR